METNRDNDPNEAPAPPKLVATLRRTQSARVFVPQTVDDAVLRASREHLTPEPRTVRNCFSGWQRWASLAGACVLLGWLVFQLTRPGASPEVVQAYRCEDVNHDGRVDILDAFQLARQLGSGAKPSPEYDVNGDGVIDRRDAEAIAAQAVKLEKGGRS